MRMTGLMGGWLGQVAIQVISAGLVDKVTSEYLRQAIKGVTHEDIWEEHHRQRQQPVQRPYVY